MPDIALTWDDAHNRADWSMAGAELTTGGDLPTAILISVFTDRMAQPDDVIPDGTGDPRGWWADADIPIGSRMWLLRRAKQIPDTLQRAYDYLAEALQWMVDDGVVGGFDIAVEWVRAGVLGAQIVAYSPAGTLLHTGRYSWAWAALN